MVHLGSGRILSLKCPETGVRIRLMAGSVWITGSGDPRDHVLTAAGAFELPEGHVVIEALTEASIEVGAG